MSRVTFRSRTAYAELSGCERAYSGSIIGHIATGVMNAQPQDVAYLLRLIEPHRMDRNDTPAQAVEWFRHVANGVCSATFRVGDMVDDSFVCALNTAIKLGNDTVRLLARLHGQCEIHGYIRRENRVWYANLIDAGIESGILRPDMNWDGVTSLCRLKNDGAVVTSYSVTGSFPSMPAGWRQKMGDEDARENAWYDQSHDKQWNTAIGTLAPAMEWSPQTWPLPFGNGLDFAIINTAVAEMSPGYGLQRRYEKPVYPFPNPAHDYEARKEADRQESADE